MSSFFYIIQEGELIKKDDSLSLIGETTTDIPIHQISDLHIMHKTKLSSECLKFLLKQNICIHYYDTYEHYLGTTVPQESMMNGELIVQQSKHYLDPVLRLSIAKQFIIGAAKNITKVSKYYQNLDISVQESIQTIRVLLNKAHDAITVSQLMGYEANIRKEYYKTWSIIIENKCCFEKRVVYPPDNLVNALISFINALLYATILSEVHKTALCPYISYLHEPSTARNSLTFDLSEIFKPLMVDRLIFYLINKNMVSEADYDVSTHKLREDIIKLVLYEWDNRLNTTVYHRQLKRDISYRHLIKQEAYKLARHLEGKEPYKPFVLWW